jgi:2-polyprenyl-6-methoxyphenol hydroxylase-like FAD-dependent oxidoreductase
MREKPLRVTARLVVGADGLRSTVAERVQAPFERVGASVAVNTYGYWSGLPTDGYEWNFLPDAASGVIPTNDGQACVYVSRGGRTSFAHTIRESSPELAERLAAATPPRVLRTFTGQRGHLRRSWGAGWALVGDAGYFKDPLTAHGLTDALRDAELLARAIVAVVAEGAEEREALAAYQRTRDALSAEFFALTDVIAGHRWTDEEIPVLLKRLSAAMADEVSELDRWSVGWGDHLDGRRVGADRSR